ncbi:MAG TPA: glycoside hydrolase family 35 protein [Acidobacteriaceae bacterium]|nr:glycoside hydrolase family 35 protein [Acidobacteriaceae bacterium]
MNLALRRTLLRGCAPALLVAATLIAPSLHAQPKQSFTISGNQFLLNGKPFEILSGEMHYARIPRAYWRARMEMARAMGLNTIATYVFWNVHEPEPGHFDFGGNADLPEFLREAQQEGLYVILRAGPYSCAEWEFGGFPAWLLADPKMDTTLRSNDPAFMIPAERWLMKLGQEVAPFQIGRGGPIIAVQMENEYGDFGSDQEYLKHLRSIFEKAGFTDALLFTTNPTRGEKNGSLDGTYAAVNFGIGHAASGLDFLANMRPGQPLFAAEYWPGWFDHWGEPHQTRPIAPQIADLNTILSRGASVNIYMFHGGTSFGFMSGASWTNNQYLPDVTSYDYDAPIDEAGHPTPKYEAYREVLAKYAGHPLPPVPQPPPVLAVADFALTESASLWKNLPAPISSRKAQAMETYGQNYGFILYRTKLLNSVLQNPDHPTLALPGLNDYAKIYLDGKLIGTLDRRLKQGSLQLDSPSRGATLDILVENDGRVNSTRMMRRAAKGLPQGATLDGQPLTGWQVYTLPITDLHKLRFHRGIRSTGPVFYRGRFHVDHPADTFLDVRALTKGAVWIDGHPIGRYWNIGPQDTLYVPGPWLHPGWNEVVVFDLNGVATPHLAGLAKPILDGPAPEPSAAPAPTAK